jgi:arylsulfate sulfotransferase
LLFREKNILNNCRTRFAVAGLITICLAVVGCGNPASSSISITPSAVTLLSGQSFHFDLVQTGASAAGKQPQPTFLVNGVAGGTSATGTITADGLYTAPAAPPGQPVTIGIKGESSSASVTVLNSSSFEDSSVAATQNPLVASYTVTIPAASSVQVQFGLDTNYGSPTAPIPSTTGGPITVLVAGMRASTLYHMQAIINLSGGSQALDSDHTFTTGAIPANRLPLMTTQVTGVGTPSNGIELLSMANVENPNLLSAFATDLAGNVIWYYELGPTAFPFPVKPMSNGHMLVNTSPYTFGEGPNEVREIDLAGNIINRVTVSAVNQSLAGVADFQINTITHDVAFLPDGHWILLVNFPETINNVTGIPDGTSMVGDALVDWDVQQGKAVWVWNSFDHLSLTHAPYGFADWTHGNAVIYSPDDGNLILSMRNQNWIVKINYANGTGDGSLLWTLGDGGDVTLPAGEAPIEWNYGQHYPTIVSPNSSGVISLMFFNDGNNRLMDGNNDICGTAGVGACYSSMTIFQLDESAKTATVLWENNLLPYYSLCCGNALLLPNGNAEVDIADDQTVNPGFSDMQEWTQTQSPELVYELQIAGLAYRGFRIPSLYPSVTWAANAQSTPGRAPYRGGPSPNAKPFKLAWPLP